MNNYLDPAVILYIYNYFYTFFVNIADARPTHAEHASSNNLIDILHHFDIVLEKNSYLPVAAISVE